METSGEYTKNFETLPESIKNLLRRAVTLLDPQEITLFGSRARGDFRENSDFDIAFKLKNDSRWSEFLAEVGVAPHTLYRTDLVNIDKLGPDYQSNIKKEGVLLYGKPSN